MVPNPGGKSALSISGVRGLSREVTVGCFAASNQIFSLVSISGFFLIFGLFGVPGSMEKK